MRTIDITEATLPLADYIKNVTKEAVIVTVRGKSVAALVQVKNIDSETVSLSNDPQFLALIQHSRTKQKVKGGLSADEMRHRLEKM